MISISKRGNHSKLIQPIINVNQKTSIYIVI